MKRGTERVGSLIARELFATFAVRAWNLTGEGSTDETPIRGRDQQKTDQAKDRQEIYKHIPSKSFPFSIIKPAGRTIGQGVMSQVRLTTLGTGK
jgi:hypothetical protein